MYICGGSSWLPLLMPLVLLGYGHVASKNKTMELLLSLWLSCGGGAFKTFEDVLLSIRSTSTDMGIEAGIPSIDNVLSHFYPACCHSAGIFTIGITSGLE